MSKVTQHIERMPPLLQCLIKRLAGSRRGAAIVEMALAAPILLMLMLGIISYGSWIAMAHSVQQSAKEAARASLSGLSPTEREQVARATADSALRRGSKIDLSKVSVSVQDDGATLVVGVSYDPSNEPMLGLSLVPLPTGPIRREAAVRLTGI